MNSLPKTVQAIEEGIQHGLHPGCQLYVSLDGDIVANTGFGEAQSGRKLAHDMILPWFSAGKPITALAIALLVAEDKLRWDTPVASVIPEFGRGRKDSIQIGHILTHTAGFRLGEVRCPETGWERILQCACDAPLEPGWLPGQKAGYQRQASWLVLGELVQRVAGEPFPDYIRNRILSPLRMENCALGMDRSNLDLRADRIAVMHRSDHNGPQPHPAWKNLERLLEPLPGANACGPVSGLGKFYEHLLSILQGRQGVLSRKLVIEMTRRQRENLYDNTFRATIDWGYGFIINSRCHGVEPLPYGFGALASDDAFGHGGVQSSSAFADPAHQLVVAWSCNGMPGEEQHALRAHRINTAIYQDLGLNTH
jgi:CubicO group peptidase (beta-lactamase class C family)